MGFLSFLDPTSSGSIWRKGLRQLDPTNPHSVEGKVWQYGVPIVAGSLLGPLGGAAAGAGVAALQGRNIAGGAVEGGLIGIGSRAAAPGATGSGTDFAATTEPGVAGAGSLAPAAAAPVTSSVTAPAAQPPPIAPPPPPVEKLTGIGYLTRDPSLIPSLLGTAARVYGAYEEGVAADRKAAFKEEVARHNVHAGGTNVRQPFDAWAAERARLRQQYGYGTGG